VGGNDEVEKIGMGGSLARLKMSRGKGVCKQQKERRLSTQAIHSGGFIPDMLHQFQLRLRL